MADFILAAPEGAYQGITGLAWTPVIFSAFSPVSTRIGWVITRDRDVSAKWTRQQGVTGALVYGTDFLFDNHQRVHLDETLWTDVILSNADGTLSIDLYDPNHVES